VRNIAGGCRPTAQCRAAWRQPAGKRPWQRPDKALASARTFGAKHSRGLPPNRSVAWRPPNGVDFLAETASGSPLLGPGRGGKGLEFDLNATAGQLFAVDLFFAEVWNGAFGQGKRVFDVVIDGTTVLKNFDVFKEAGGGNIGIARRFVIKSDGKIDIDLKRITQNPMLSGLRITPLGNSSES